MFTSISGSQIRLRLSNEFGNGAVTMSSVHIALSTSGGSIDASTDKALTFSGAAAVTIATGQAVFSDPLAFALPALTKVAITIAFGATPRTSPATRARAPTRFWRRGTWSARRP